MKGPSKSRSGMIDLMRFLFTLVIMIFHSSRAFPGGYIAVEFFFIVSGYLMARSADRRSAASIGKDTFSFIIRKAAGIFSVYMVAWLADFVLSHLMYHTAGKAVLVDLFRSPYNFFMLGMSGNASMGHQLTGSWYLSALLLAMLILYPIRKKKPLAFDYIGAPVIVLFFVGYVYQAGQGIGMTVQYTQDLLLCNGTLRAFAEIALGCFCYRIGQHLSRLQFTRLGQILLSILELGGYGLVGYGAWKFSGSDLDLVFLGILAVSVTLSFSGKGIHAPMCSNRIFHWLGKFSLCLYLSHTTVQTKLLPYVWINFFRTEVPTYATAMYFALYLVMTFALSGVYYLMGSLIRKAAPKLVKLLCKPSVQSPL